MPQVIEITCPPAETGALVQRLRQADGVVGISVQPQISLEPPGDVVSVKASNSGARRVLGVVAELGLSERFSLAISEPDSLISPKHFSLIDRETNETTWEGLAFELRKHANPGFNLLLLMALSGGIAAIGLWVDLVHIVVGAMVIAPGFQPLLRVPFGLLLGVGTMTSRGIFAVVAGYLSLAVASGLLLVVLRAVDPSRSPLLEDRFWVRFWSTPTPEGAILAVVAGAAGAATVTAGRTVLTAGVMVALSLIPAMAIAGMALASGDIALFADAVRAWGVDALAVMLMGALVFGGKHALVHKRRPLG